WGNIREQSGTTVNRHIFTGQEYDENTGLINFGVRLYEPETARFVTQDAYLGEMGVPPSLHRYLYAYSNPSVYVDLYGNMSVNWEIDNAAVKAAAEGGAWGTAKLFFWTGVKTVYTVPNILTINFIFKHDELRDKYDLGEISGLEYTEGSGWAGAESLTKGVVMYYTGGLAGTATKGLNATVQFMSAGTAAAAGYQATEDAFQGELSSAGTYLKMGAGGAFLGLLARGGHALYCSEIGNMSLGQLLKGKTGNKIITAESLSGEPVELVFLKVREAAAAARTEAAAYREAIAAEAASAAEASAASAAEALINDELTVIMRAAALRSALKTIPGKGKLVICKTNGQGKFAATERYRMTDLGGSDAGNIAFSNMNLGGVIHRSKAFSAKSWTPRGYLETTLNPKFRTMKIDPRQRVDTPQSWDRVIDCEARILERTARICDMTNRPVQGRIMIRLFQAKMKSALIRSL
ncbi:MAG: RHS repeat-associated core domain-containing protein, partial [Gammaproteobacteria bacterium]|nr:RHS repeat-associated core domain-containing protein [Gammaproteobacteria bacterium]